MASDVRHDSSNSSLDYGRLYTLLCALVLSCANLGQVCAAGNIDPECVKATRELGVPIWKSLGESLRDIECAYVLTVTTVEVASDEVEHRKVLVLDTIYAADSLRNVAFLDVRHGEGEAHNRRVINPKYTFMVAKELEDQPFQLLARDARTKHSHQAVLGDDTQFIAATNCIRSGFTILGTPLDALLAGADSGFELQVAKYLGDGGGEGSHLVHLEARYVGPKSRYIRDKGLYWADVDSHNSWMIDNCGVTTETEIITIDVDYQSVQGIGVFPAKYRYKLSNSPITTYELRHEVQFGVPTHCTRVDEEFYLPFYGLPEWEVDRSASHAWQYWLWTAGLFVLGSVYLALRRWRPRTAHQG